MKGRLKTADNLRRAALFSVALAGVVLLIYYTRAGPAVRGDSVRYVMGAENLLHGHGYSRTSGGGETYIETGFAPLLSYTLAFFGLFKLDLYVVGRVMNIALFGLSTYMVGTLLARYADSTWLGVIGGLLFILTGNILEWHAWLMSEPLYIAFTLGALVVLLRSLDTGSLPLVALSALLAGISSLARYIGISFVPAAVLAILFFGRREWKSRILRAAVYAVVGLAPFILWMARNQLAGGTGVANREIIFHVMRPDVIKLYLFEITSWFIPEALVLPRVVRAGVAIILAGAAPALFVVDRWRKRKHDRGFNESAITRMPWILLFFIPAYALVLIVNSFLLDAGTTESAVIRYLTPMLVFLIMLELSTISNLLGGETRRRRQLFALLYLLFVAAFSVAELVPQLKRSSVVLGFTALRSEQQGVIARLETLDPEKPLISNNPEMVYYLIDRPAYMKPIKYDLYQQADRDDFEEQLELAETRLQEGSLFIQFGKPTEEEQEVIRRLGVKPAYKSGDVTIYSMEDTGD
jgi:hypothetical protein